MSRFVVLTPHCEKPKPRNISCHNSDRLVANLLIVPTELVSRWEHFFSSLTNIFQMAVIPTMSWSHTSQKHTLYMTITSTFLLFCLITELFESIDVCMHTLTPMRVLLTFFLLSCMKWQTQLCCGWFRAMLCGIRQRPCLALLMLQSKWPGLHAGRHQYPIKPICFSSISFDLRFIVLRNSKDHTGKCQVLSTDSRFHISFERWMFTAPFAELMRL